MHRTRLHGTLSWFPLFYPAKQKGLPMNIEQQQMLEIESDNLQRSFAAKMFYPFPNPCSWFSLDFLHHQFYKICWIEDYSDRGRECVIVLALECGWIVFIASHFHSMGIWTLTVESASSFRHLLINILLVKVIKVSIALKSSAFLEMNLNLMTFKWK